MSEDSANTLPPAEFFLKQIYGEKAEAPEEILTEEDARALAMANMTPYQRDLATLGEHFHIHKDIIPDEFLIVMRARWPDVDFKVLCLDVEQHLDPEHRRHGGDYELYFSRTPQILEEEKGNPRQQMLQRRRMIKKRK